MNAYQQLESLFTELDHLSHLRAISEWDEAAMMPTGGGPARAAALATLHGIMHQKLTTPSVNDWLQEAKTLPHLDSAQQRNLYWMERQYQSATCLPAKLVHAMAEQGKLCEQAWRQCRAQNDWQNFAPKLAALFKLIKEAATRRAQVFNLNPYDALIDEYCPGFSQATIDPIFNQLRDTLPTLIKQIIHHQKTQHIIQPTGEFPVYKQRELGLQLMKAIGFDFNHGRLDVSHHPFCGGVAEDVRITTRYNTHEFVSALMGICHETGHACYEQGLPKQWLQQPVGKALGMAVHESQSLLTEMDVCRCEPYFEFLSPLLIEFFGRQAAFTPDNLFHLGTQVKPGFIRVDADEVTYPLHVILRYEIERDLFNDKITIDDLPAVWNDKMENYLGLSTLGDDKDGVLQDVHWPSGAFGYFPAYTLGRLIAAQLYQSLLKQHPSIPQQIGQGDFSTILQWLREHVHQKASLVTTEALLKEATGEALNPQYFINHINNRYLQSVET